MNKTKTTSPRLFFYWAGKNKDLQRLLFIGDKIKHEKRAKYESHAIATLAGMVFVIIITAIFN